MSYEKYEKMRAELLASVKDEEERTSLEKRLRAVEEFEIQNNASNKRAVNINIDPSIIGFAFVAMIPLAVLAFLAFCIWIGYKAAGVI